jgi:hypothetical protein
LFFPFSF